MATGVWKDALTSHQRNTNKNHNGVPPHTHWNGYFIFLKGKRREGRDRKSQISKNTEKLECSCWQECKIVQPLWQTVWQLLKKLNTRFPYNSATPLLGIHRRTESVDLNRYEYTHVVTFFLGVKRCPLTKSEQIKGSPSIQWNEYYSASKEEGNSDTCYDMDEP